MGDSDDEFDVNDESGAKCNHHPSKKNNKKRAAKREVIDLMDAVDEELLEVRFVCVQCVNNHNSPMSCRLSPDLADT